MKKLSLYVFLVLMFCNVEFAQCIEGDCKNGYGTFTFPDGRKYVGESKDSKKHEWKSSCVHECYLFRKHVFWCFRVFCGVTLFVWCDVFLCFT